MGDSAAPLFLTGEPEIKFRLTDVDPPSRVYIARDDIIRITLWTRTSTFPVTVNMRILRPNGEIIPNQWQVIPQGSMLSSASEFNLMEGYLLSVGATMLPIQLTRGDAFLVVELIRSATPTYIPNQVLISGYLTAKQNLSWPGSPVLAPYDQRGLIRSLALTDPAAGVEASQTVPSGVMWRVKGLFYQLVTDATVINRIGCVIIDDGTNVLFNLPPAALSTASGTFHFSWGDGLGNLFTAPFLAQPLPRDLIMLTGWRIRTATTNLQAGDNINIPFLTLEEWPVGL